MLFKASRLATLVVGVATATATSILLPSAADAAASTTINLVAPAIVGNDGTGSGNGSVAVTNGDTGVPFARVDITFSGISALKATNLKLTGLPAGDTATVSDTGTTVTAQISPAVPLGAGQTETIPFVLTITSGATPISGTLSSTATLHSVAQASDTAAGTVLATSAAQSTQVASGPSAPKFNVPGPATVHQSYSATVLSPGSPKPTIRVYDNKPNSGATGTTATAVAPTVGSNGDALYALNDKLVFDATTGTVTGTAANLTKTDASPDSFTIIANNGVGGADTAAAATAATPAVTVHDVSQTITIPVLFSDVAVSSQFGKAIYALAADGTLSGYGDGTFRPGTTVSRQAFVHFAAGVLNKGGFTTSTGPCTTASPSTFSDVPNSSQFCQDIASLSSLGVVNGYSDGTFKPGATVSRQAEAAFLYRVDEKFRNVDPKTGGDALCTSPSPFSDVTSSNTFCGDIEWASKNGITKGYSDGGFHPAAGSSRQASAQFIYQLEILEKLA